YEKRCISVVMANLSAFADAFPAKFVPPGNFVAYFGAMLQDAASCSSWLAGAHECSQAELQWIVELQRSLSRTVANYCVYPETGALVRQLPNVAEHVQGWLRSADAEVRQHALRAQYGMVSEGLHMPRYAEGVHLLHPVREAGGGAVQSPRPLAVAPAP